MTALFDVGVVGAPGVPTSFIASASVACPGSLNTVGQGFVAEHGAGVVTLVTTSESRKAVKLVGLLPFAAWMELTIR